jgi:hypothetical protein
MSVTFAPHYYINSGTIQFSGTGNRTVTFTGVGALLAKADAVTGQLLSPFGTGSILIADNKMTVLASVNSATQATVALDWAGSTSPDLPYLLFAPSQQTAIIQELMKQAANKGGLLNPFREFVWDDGAARLRIVTEGGLIKFYVGATKSGGTETATVLAQSIDPATGAYTTARTINMTGGTPTWPFAGSSLQIAGNTGVPSILLVNYGGAVGVYGARAAGTVGSPATVGANSTLYTIGGYAHDGAAWSSGTRASISLLSAETWGPGAHGTRIRLSTTLNGTTTLVTRLHLENNGALNAGVDNVGSLGEAAARWNALNIGTGASRFDGLVGVGTAATYKLDIRDTVANVFRMSGGSADALTWLLRADNGGTAQEYQFGVTKNTHPWNAGFYLYSNTQARLDWRLDAATGYTGFGGTPTPAATLDINGTVAFRSGSVALANGLNSNIATPAFAAARVTGPTGAFSVGGLTGGVDGRIVKLYNSVAQTMTIVNEDASSTAGNRIKTLTGANIVLRATANSHVTFRYDASDARWIVESIN